uniref:Pif-5.1 n=1 Tax=Venturia canescens TaxID=32260 RepID=A0A0U1ZIC9_9HYME|nr:Pif-5.1 [Venturia canescens]
MSVPLDIELVKAQKRVTDFLSKLKILGGPTKSTSVASIQKWLKHVHIGIPPLDKALRSLRVEKTHGYLTFSGRPSGALYTMFRAADLGGIIKLSMLKIPIRASEQLMFDKLMARNPEKLAREISEAVAAARSKHLGLTTRAVPLEKIPSKSKGILKSFVDSTTTSGSRSKRYTTGSACWMITTRNSKKFYCRIRQYSCHNPEGRQCDGAYSNLYNVTLVIMAIVELPDDDKRKQDLADETGHNVRLLDNFMKEMINDQFDTLKAFVKRLKDKNQLPTVDVCGSKHRHIENSEIPMCRMCNSSADPKSTEYSDPKQYPENISFHCIPGDGAKWDKVDEATVIWNSLKLAVGNPCAAIRDKRTRGSFSVSK